MKQKGEKVDLAILENNKLQKINVLRYCIEKKLTILGSITTEL
jgi:hypothetical protein